MSKISAVIVAVCALTAIFLASAAADNNAPHNAASFINCGSCHGRQALMNSPFWNGGDAPDYDRLCFNCHDAASPPYTDTSAPLVKTHSSANTSDQYGTWAIRCVDCHDPHAHQQLQWKRTDSVSLYLASGRITNYSYDAASSTSTLITEGMAYKAGWDAEGLTAKTSEERHAIIFPNLRKVGYSFPVSAINDPDPNTITVKGDVRGVYTYVTPPTDFGIIYGQYIRQYITRDDGSYPVKFFDQTGTGSFVDGNATYNGICQVCHTQTAHFRRIGVGGASDQTHTNVGGATASNCISCHPHTAGFGHGSGRGGGDGTGCSTAAGCHQEQKGHPAHVGGMLEGVTCLTCHEENNFPAFADGANLTATTVCNNCHSGDGAVLAKQYFSHPGSSTGAAGSWRAVEGDASFCGSCHDASPGNTKQDGSGTNGANIMGNKTTYGFYVTGHGKASGNYSRLSWQDTTATGNPAANKGCAACHDLTSQHFNNPGKRLKAGFASNQANDNCNNCHAAGQGATADPQFYTTSAAYEASAHGAKLCTDCHEVHGATGGVYPGMTKTGQENLCANCHANGGHPGVGSATFTVGGKSYTLECVSCHNVHVVTGTYSQADQNKSPVTRLTDITNVWGDAAGEKMNAYAGSGKYQTPTGESFSGAQLPDYATFCLACHGEAGSPPFGINWGSDPHGRGAANSPNGGGTCPDWFACGRAKGWEGDDCVGDQADCWPVISSGKGDQIWSREAFKHEERIAGANFTLSCTDCHTGHGSGTLGRGNVNGGAFTSNWGTMCNNCHYYYSDWHAGFGCGSASCHVENSPHRSSNMSGSGATRSFNQDLVLSYSFENNLNDSGDWHLHGKWFDNAGSYAAGKSGQAVVLSGSQNVQVGTRNASWSTDEGYHGTWKYTEMKYNTALEAWVYPTDNSASEYVVFSKHTGYGVNGGYQLALKKIGSTYRAVFNMAADNNGGTQDGRAGVRGAYSSVAIPLNTWTHIGATFDTAGPDRNAGDPRVGRIRIYVNGEDVTTSSLGGDTREPGSGETSIYAYSENSPWNQSICFDGQWCASEFAIGGFHGWQNVFIGRIDEAKVWNVTKDAAYFAAYDAQAAPYISTVEGNTGSNQLIVTFSEGVYTNTGASGALVAADFTLTDADNGRTITGVSHTAGSATATLTLSSALDSSNDINVDTLAAKSNAIYDEYSNAADTTAVTITTPSSCPAGTVTFNLNEASGSAYVFDGSGIISGAVTGGAAALTGSAYSGDGASRYIDFENNDTCLQATTAMTLEARVKPAGIPADGTDYVKRILARDGGGNYQMSLWRKNGTSDQDPPNTVVTVALWINNGTGWKAVLTDFSVCPIVNDKWYQIKAVWNSSVVGGIPATIYVDDQGANDDDAGESWAGYKNCTDSDQSQMPAASRVSEGDVISPADGDFVIGGSASTPHTNNAFNGLIDWITWKDTVD